MKSACRVGCCMFALSFMVVWGTPAWAREDPDMAIPDALESWVPWVLHPHADRVCPFAYDVVNRPLCMFPSRISLALTTQGGRFRLQAQVYNAGWIRLPSTPAFWPKEVRVGGAAAIVVARQGKPSVRLPAGDHQLEGRFFWPELPEYLDFDARTAMVELSVNGDVIAYPRIEAAGRLWIRQAARPAMEEDTLNLRVFRKYEDGRPAMLITRLELEISGKNREIVLGPVLPPEFTPIEVSGDLPAQWEHGDMLRLQLRPGSKVMHIRARCSSRLIEITRPQAQAPWPSEEVWTVVSHPEIRQINVTQLAKLDPQQTLLPDAWKAFPAYLFPADTTMAFDELIRGYANSEPDRVSVFRELWLDFDGAGYTLRDRLSGQIKRHWRLETTGPISLGHVTVNDEDRLITQAATSQRSGIELRRGSLDMIAESRVTTRDGALPAVGWDVDADSLETRLHLPPGWRLLTAFGVDRADGAWLAKWDVFDMFLVLLLTLAIGYLWGPWAGGIGFVCFVLIHQEPGAPRWIWFSLSVAVAFLRVLPKGWMTRVAEIWKIVSMVLILLISSAFAIKQVRGGFFPHISDQRVPPYAMANVAYSDGSFTKRMRGSAPKPSAPQELRQEAFELEEAMPSQRDMPSLLQKAGPSTKKRYGSAQFQIDPQASVQTGPGVPNWRWETVRLVWNGPVDGDQTVRLWLLSPLVNTVLALFQVALLIALIAVTFEVKSSRLTLFRRHVKTPIIVFLAATVACLPMAKADVPPPKLLQELERRLTEKPDCAPHCADIAQLSVEVDGSSFSWQFTVHAMDALAVPLPGKDDWCLQQVTQNGNPVRSVMRGADGFVWVSVPKGITDWTVTGRVPMNETLSLVFPIKPRSVDVAANGWRVQGIHEDGSVDSQLLFTRLTEEPSSGDLPTSQVFSPFFVVQRKLILGLEWEVETTLRRLTPAGPGAAVSVPLLPGESVTTPGIDVKDQMVHINLSGDAMQASWRSTLAITSRIALQAPEQTNWDETWVLDASPIWHIRTEGFPPIRNQNEDGVWQPTWLPWPGEKIVLEITRPESVAGPTLTIDQTRLEVTPGTRLISHALHIALRTSRGEPLTIDLGADTELQSLTIDGQTKPFNIQDGKLEISLNPGQRDVALEWRKSKGISTFFKVAPIRLSAPGLNHDVTVRMPHNRWTLFVGGPRLGPVVLFWPYLLVLLIVCVALGRLGWAPIKPYQWFLLGIGLMQVDIMVVVIALVFGWLLALGLKERHGSSWSYPQYNVIQIGLALITFVALCLILASIHHGLLGSPDMQIAGYGSSRTALMWYQERSADVLPQPWVLSLPLWSYRLAMLAWSLWLALKLITWLKWGWGAFANPRLWAKPAAAVPRRQPPPIPDAPEGSEGG